MHDELRRRLARLDPMPPGVPVEPTTSESSRQLMEDIMSTELKEGPARQQPNRPRTWLAAAAMALVLVGVVGAVGLDLGGSPDVAAQPLELNAGGEDPFASCLAFSVEDLAKAPIAFEGVVTSAEGDRVELEVSRWFKGGDAGAVALNAPQGMEALIGGIPFAVGETYLITAYGSDVNYCGFSGVATPEMTAAFEAAFGA